MTRRVEDHRPVRADRPIVARGFEVFAHDAHLLGLRALLPALRRYGTEDRLRAIAEWPLDG